MHIVSFLLRSADIVVETRLMVEDRRSLVEAVEGLGMTPTKGAYFLTHASTNMIDEATNPEGRRTLLKVVDLLHIPRELSRMHTHSSDANLM